MVTLELVPFRQVSGSSHCRNFMQFLHRGLKGVLGTYSQLYLLMEVKHILDLSFPDKIRSYSVYT